MAVRRVSADPSMGEWIQEIMEREEKAGTEFRERESLSGFTTFMALISTPECTGQNKLVEDSCEKPPLPCMWKGKIVHEGPTHQEIADKYWHIIYGRSYLGCHPDVYRYTACMLGRSLSKKISSSRDRKLNEHRRVKVRKSRNDKRKEHPIASKLHCNGTKKE